VGYDNLERYVAKNGKEYTVCTKRLEERFSEKVCLCSGPKWPHQMREVRVEITEMYDEDGVDVPRTPQSRIYRDAQRRYDADGKWHPKGCAIR